MLTAKTEDNRIVLAHESQKSNGGFVCPECGSTAILKKPKRKIDHFAHASRSACSMGGESIKHAEIKFRIYENYKNLGHDVLIEHKIGKRRCDVAVKVNNSWIAIEVQLSPIPHRELVARTENHTAHGYFTMWVTELERSLDEVKKGVQYPVRAFQCDIHDDIHNNQLFQYEGSGEFSAIHLMGYRYKTFKHYKIVNTKFRLSDLNGYRRNDLLTVSVPDRNMWWERIKNNNGGSECQH